MKTINLQHIVDFKVGHYKEPFVVTADCIPTDENGIYDIKIVVKSKKRNRRKIHKGQIEILNVAAAIETVKEYMACGDVVQDMIKNIAVKLIRDFPICYPDIEGLESDMYPIREEE